MPFVRGRYYVNPMAGEALEAALDFESQLFASRGTNRRNEAQRDKESIDVSEKGSIRRIEIETAELVPSQAGSAEKGYVIRIHRQSPIDSGASERSSGRGEAQVFYDKATLLDFLNTEFGKDEKAGSPAED